MSRRLHAHFLLMLTIIAGTAVYASARGHWWVVMPLAVGWVAVAILYAHAWRNLHRLQAEHEAWLEAWEEADP